MPTLSRGVDPALLAIFATRGWHPCTLVYIDHPSGAVRAHSGGGDLGFNGATWRGVGGYGRIGLPGETSGGAARRTTMTLYGKAVDLIAEAKVKMRGRRGEVWFGAVTARNGNVIAADPTRIWRGTADAIRFELTRLAAQGALSVDAALQLSFVSGPALRRNASQHHSLEDHAVNYSATDTAMRLFQHAETDQLTLTWPEGSA